MQGIKQYLFLSIIGILFSLVYSRSIVEKDHNCVIIVNNQYAAKSDDKKYHKRQEPKQFVNSLMLEINELIVENKDTYENPKNLEQTNLLNKRGDEKDVGYVKYISTIDEYTILSAYLSHQLNEDVKAIPGVESCGPEINFRILSQDKIVEVEPRKEKEHVKRSESKKSLNSFINDIKAQTGWKDVGVRKSVTNNYSLMSQGFYNGKHSSYDQNYYYPKSGGKDIDIYLIDSGFDFTHSDFSNKNERQAQCIAYIEINNRAVTKINQKQCISEFNNEYYVGRHGEYTSRAIAGKDFGVAPNANIYGISINYINEYKISDMKLYKFLDFLLYEIEIRPNKSILALPIMLNYDYTFEFDNKKNKFNLIQKYINALTKKGVIVIASAGNGVDEDSNGNYIGRPVRDKDYRIFPCSLDNVICVGGTDTIEGLEINEREFYIGLTLHTLRLIGADPEIIATITEQLNSLTLEELENDIGSLISDIEKAEGDEKIYYDSIKFEILNEKFANLMKSSNTTITYKLGEWSDYGRDVDIYAPGFFYAEYQNINSENVDVYNHGTSFATPIVSGVIATIMSEHPHIKFTPKTMLDYLKKTGLKNIVSGVPEGYPNVFINNGKQLVYSSDNKYHGCGIQAGNQQCPRHQCCSSEGKCTKDKKVCANSHKHLIKYY